MGGGAGEEISGALSFTFKVTFYKFRGFKRYPVNMDLYFDGISAETTRITGYL